MRRFVFKAALVGMAMLAPTALLADDQETAQNVANNLKGNLTTYKVNVKVKDGTAWLNGAVSSPGQLATALDIANQTEGVEHVVNNLTVGGTTAGTKSGSSGLRQPSGVANAVTGGNRATGEEKQEYSYAAPPSSVPPAATSLPAAIASNSRRSRVVQASAQLPDHAEQELLVAGPLSDAEEVAPEAGGSNQASYSNPARVPMPVQSQGNPKRLPQANTAMPLAMAPSRPVPARPAAMQDGGAYCPPGAGGPEAIGAPQPMQTGMPMGPGAPAPYHFDHPQMPGYAWPSYAAYPNYAAVTYPKQYSPTAWPYIGPFYPYPQVPLGWRKVTMEWKDGWWFLDFKDSH